MTVTQTGEFSVSLEDSTAFARLSGDYNPLHVDAIAARRLRFGGTVTHGVHLFLRALDELAARGALNGQAPSAMTATFDNPVLTGAVVSTRANVDGSRIRIVADVNGTSAFTGTLELGSSLTSNDSGDDSEFAPAQPRDLAFPPTATEGTVLLKLSRSLLRTLFPSLAARPDIGWIADLLATTQIVGMQCPGMHSIYSGFKLRRTQANNTSVSMQYRVNGVEKRFHMLRMEVNGPRLAGSVDTFFRPRPVEQRSMAEIARVVAPDVFSGNRVLVIGGSRGLGELTAKIVAAGGADVTITHARGKQDAERVCAEIKALDRTCTAQFLDVLAPAGQAAPQWLTATPFSHVYFFASSLIAKNSGRWNESLFAHSTRMYVTAFAAVVDLVLGARADNRRATRFFYPSSIFVTQPETGFAEYAVAKAAGEALCDQLQGRRGAQFSKPRLPRMRTDQTSALTDIGAVDPFPVMLEVVRNLHTDAERARA